MIPCAPKSHPLYLLSLCCAVTRNIRTFLTNYALILLLVIVYVVFSNPSLLVWAAVLAAVGIGARRWLARVPSETVAVGSHHIAKKHVNLAVSVAMASVALWIVGHDIFVFIGVSAMIILCHALFRTPTMGSGDVGGDAGAATRPSPTAGSAFLYSSPSEAPVV